MDVSTKEDTVFIADNYYLRAIPPESLNQKTYSPEDIKGELISRVEIEQRIKDIAREIESSYSSSDTHLLWVREGAKPFYDSLASYLTKEYDVSAIKVESMRGTKSGPLTIENVGGLDTSVLKDKRVLLIEDILDTGKTILALEGYLRSFQPSSFDMVTLLHKRTPKSNGYVPRIAGFEIPDEFVIGFGLDYNNTFRDLPSICVISDLGEAKYAMKNDFNQK